MCLCMPARDVHMLAATHSRQRPNITTVSWLGGPWLALGVRVERLLHLLLLPLLPAAAFGPFGHLVEGSRVHMVSPQPRCRQELSCRQITVAWPWMRLPGCEAAKHSQPPDQRTNWVHKLMLASRRVLLVFSTATCEHQVMPSWPVAEMSFLYLKCQWFSNVTPHFGGRKKSFQAPPHQQDQGKASLSSIKKCHIHDHYAFINQFLTFCHQIPLWFTLWSECCALK